MTRFAALLAVLLAASLATAFAAELSVQAPPVSATFQSAPGGTHIRAPGYLDNLSPGDPALPFVDLGVLLPPDADLSSLTAEPILAETVALDGSYDIAPAPPAVTVVDGTEVLDWGAGKQVSGGRNMLVYGRDAFYPAANVEVVEVGEMRQWKIAQVRYYPYRWNPASGELECSSAGAIRISYSVDARPQMEMSLAGDDLFAGKVESLTVNYDEARTWYDVPRAQSDAQPQANSGYLILTTSSIVSGSSKLQSFITHKANRGYNVAVATEQQWGGGTGDAAAEAIRSYLKSNYLQRGLHYVLLIGNPNPASGTVPMKMLWPRHNQSTYQEAPSDYYYADLTGNWDRDGDGYFGEEDNDFGPGGVDRLPEVIVGRIPYYGSFSDLDSILQKIMDYETGVYSGAWNRRVLLSMEPSDEVTPGYHLGEAIKRDVVVPGALTAVRVYDADYGLDPPAEYLPCNTSNVLSAWQQKAGMHVWWTHGSTTSAADVFSSGMCQNLDDRYPSFTFQGSCENGHPEVTSNLGYSLLRRGAIAAVSATRVSWYYPGQTSFVSSDSNAGMAYRYSVELLKKRLACGDAHYATLTGLPRGIWMNHCVFNLYGDPSVIRADGPAITHAPLTDTDNETEPYDVRAEIVSLSGLAAGEPRLLWKENGDPSFAQIQMQPGAGDEYLGQIPAQAEGSNISYYITATDVNGFSGASPAYAPASVHSFAIAPDTVAPLISHVPLVDTGNDEGPYDVVATVTDERAVGDVMLFYRLNDGPVQSAEMTNTAGSSYSAAIPGPTATGDLISYYISATDASRNANTTRHPIGGYHTFGITQLTTVAVLNSSDLPAYSIGGNGNPYAATAAVLQGDPQTRFDVKIVTSLTPADLSGRDVIVLPDNGVAVADLQAVDDWFRHDKKIIALDSAVCFAAYSGYMWPSCAGSHGYSTHWDYSSGSNNQKIWKSDPITYGCAVDQIIESRSSQTQYYTDMLPSDAVALSGRSTDPARCYAAYRDVPGKGRIVVLGPFSPPLPQQQSLFREAVAPTPPLVTLRQAKWINSGSGVLLEDVVITCDLDGYGYVQSLDRAGGIRISSAGCPPAGSVVDIYGRMNTYEGERIVEVLSFTPTGVQSALQPLAVGLRDVGGSGVGLQQPVWEYRFSDATGESEGALVPMGGLCNVGLLVRVAGRVTESGLDYFYIDDGSRCDDGSGKVGVRVLCLLTTPPPTGAYVQFDAISTTSYRGGVLFRALLLPAGSEPRVLIPPGG